MTEQNAPSNAPWPGSKQMPQWNQANLIDAPKFTWKNWFALLGPGLILGGSAIGGGEWLVGPKVTALYGGALLWLATISVLGQCLYNIEISRYTLYTGEPIFTGKFRTAPGPKFWVVAYLLFDFGSVFPYLAANAATPVATLILDGEMPVASEPFDYWLMKGLGYAIFIGALIPLLFGGKIYRSLKVVMTFKLVVVFGFLLFLAFFYSNVSTWTEITSGFFKFGNVPVVQGEDTNGNGELDDGEDFDVDGTLDVVEPVYALRGRLTELAKAETTTEDANGDGELDEGEDKDNDGKLDSVDAFTAGSSRFEIHREDGGVSEIIDSNEDDSFKVDDVNTVFEDVDGDDKPDGANVTNLFSSIFSGDGLPDIDFTMIAFIAALAAIAGSGGLSNTPTSNYTRDQGWGMGHHVGAIPSAVGGHDIELSHVGTVFDVNDESLPRWQRWYKHVCRDQLAVWLPACFVGLALPAMLSIQFLQRGTEAGGKFTMAVMMAEGVQDSVTEASGSSIGDFCWFMTVFCGFLVLAPTMSASADGIIRRWVDVFWTSSSKLREMDPKHIKTVYLKVLLGYALFGLIMLSFDPSDLINYATMFFNIALGFSCWHTVWLNMTLLPKELRPNWFIRIALSLAGCFYMLLGVISVLKTTGVI